MAIFAAEVLTPAGWIIDARVTIEAGRIASVTANSTPVAGDERHAILVPGMDRFGSRRYAVRVALSQTISAFFIAAE